MAGPTMEDFPQCDEFVLDRDGVTVLGALERGTGRIVHNMNVYAEDDYGAPQAQRPTSPSRNPLQPPTMSSAAWGAICGIGMAVAAAVLLLGAI